jgi:hypothetical protein
MNALTVPRSLSSSSIAAWTSFASLRCFCLRCHPNLEVRPVLPQAEQADYGVDGSLDQGPSEERGA